MGIYPEAFGNDRPSEAHRIWQPSSIYTILEKRVYSFVGGDIWWYMHIYMHIYAYIYMYKYTCTHLEKYLPTTIEFA